MNNFVIPDVHRRIPATTSQRPENGAAVVFVFSPDFREVVTLFGSRFGNRKVPSGGIDDADVVGTNTIVEAARRGALRELKEEADIEESSLMVVSKANTEDYIRAPMKRYYFIGVAKERMAIIPHRAQEEGKNHWVDDQRWEPVEFVLRGASYAGERYNTLYSIALARVLEEMRQMDEFKNEGGFKDLIIDLGCSGIMLADQIALLETRKDAEEASRKRG